MASTMRFIARFHCQVAVRVSSSALALQCQVEVVLRESLGQTLAPLDHHHGVVEVGVEVQGVQFGQQVGGAVVEQPVDVDMHHRGAPGAAGRDARGPARSVGEVTGPSTSMPSAIPLASAVFPAPERAGQHHHVTGPELPAEPLTKSHGVVNSGHAPPGQYRDSTTATVTA